MQPRDRSQLGPPPYRATCYGWAMRIVVLACALLACALLACGSDSPATHASQRRELRAAEALLGATLTLRGEADGLSAWLADDAAMLYPDAALQLGAPAVRDFLRQPGHGAALHLHAIAGDVSADGQLGYSFGSLDEAGAPIANYLAAWRRIGVTWRLAAWVRIAAKRAPSPPAAAAILAGEHGVAHPGEPAALRAQAFAADAAFSALSVARGYTTAFTRYAAADAVIIGGSNLFWNAAGVAHALGGWTPVEELAWAPRTGRAAASGDLAFTVGEATFTTTSGVTFDRSYSKYLTVWIHQADGSWHFLLDGGNDSPAPPGG